MRPLIALVGSALILLGVHFYLRFAASLRHQPAAVVTDTAATGVYSADITLTFDAQADEFSLEPISLVFRHQTKELLKRTDLVAAGDPLMIRNIDGIIEGPNEFYLEVVPRDDGKQLAKATRVRLFRDGVVVADTTLWSEPGQVPRGRITLEVTPAQEGSHDHAE